MANLDQIIIIGTLLGLYVGVVPVFLGFYFLPLLRRISKQRLNIVVSLSLGVLIFLFVDVAAESMEMANKLPAGMLIPADGQANIPIFDELLFKLIRSNADLAVYLGPIILVGGFTLGLIMLLWVEFKIRNYEMSPSKSISDSEDESIGKQRNLLQSFFNSDELPQGFILAFMISFGIGLHNLGEGLAVGVAYGTGNITLATALIFGFAVHNLTEGVAITAPVSKSKLSLVVFLLLGLIAGGPTILGSLLGLFTFSNAIALFFFALAAGSLLKVIVDITNAVGEQFHSNYWNFLSVLLGFCVMYLTSLLIVL